MKQAIAVRTDLRMGKGKLATQVAHASIGAFVKADGKAKEKWLREGMMKIVVKVSSEKELEEAHEKAMRLGLPADLVSDAGRTQLEPGTKTAVGIGPAEDGKIDQITGKMKLL
ncbi:MAG: peptidyl-tRNA hydrolase Pth2 [Candidatus Aenigmatarchaeota archaeon]